VTALAQPLTWDADASAPTLLSDAVESDRLYFSLAATVEPLAGAELAWMPGLAHSSASVVVQRINPHAVLSGGPAFLDRIERRLSAMGTPVARLYLDRSSPAADAILTQAGYQARHELIFAGELRDGRCDGLEIRSVTSDADWHRKRAFHEETGARPDGHESTASDWVEMERRKCAAGGMLAFSAEIGGRMVGVCNALASAQLVRLKNIAVHPGHRRQGIGSRMLARVSQAVSPTGLPLCIYAVAGEAGEFLYRAIGLVELGRVVEWSKPLTVSEA
jgi:GNAT superfamily N-acetyltransferase